MRRSLLGTFCTTGKVVSTIGTAPRSPDQDRKSWSRQGVLNQLTDNSTDRGLASRSRTSPTTNAGTSSASSSLGVTNNPSITKRLI